MIEIKDLLSNIKDLLLSEEIKKGVIIEAIFDVVKIKIEAKDIKIKNGTIYLQIKPIYKNEVFLNKEKILVSLENSLGKRKFVDIR